MGRESDETAYGQANGTRPNKRTVMCIYCSTAMDPAKGQGDHIIPSQLGEFRYDRRFRRICPACNNRIGRAEQHFLQCGPEALFRQIVAPALKRRPKNRASIGRSAHGAPPPKALIETHGHTQIVHPIEGTANDVEPIDQLVIRNRAGSDQHIRLHRGMRPDQLRQKADAAGIQDAQAVWLDCADANWEHFRSLVGEVWPQCNLVALPATEIGTHRVKGGMLFTVTDAYFRVIAKIAFHYYLVHNRRNMRGDEPKFEGLRRFILEEKGDPANFVTAGGSRMAVSFGVLSTGAALLPSQWCHTLGAIDEPAAIVGYVRLFAGPMCAGQPYEVRLAQSDHRISLPQPAFGHVYRYARDQATKGYTGDVSSATIIRRQ